MSPYILPPRPRQRYPRRLILAHALVIAGLFSWSCLLGWGLVKILSWLF